MSKAWLRRLLIAATLALTGALAAAGPASANYLWR
jgi:hypothetical protein